jgi:hypothetical protein
MDLLDQIDEVLGTIREELVKAVSKFGAFNSAHEGYAVILEEVDELWDEIKANKVDGATDRQRGEALQIAAMGARFLLDIKPEAPGDS